MRSFFLVITWTFLCFIKVGPVLGDAPKEAEAKARERIKTYRALTDPDRRQEAIVGLGKLGTPAVAPLAELLRDRDPELREAAARAFGEMEQPVVVKALPLLIEAMKSEKEGKVLEALAKVIAHAEEAAVPGLVDLVRSTTGDVRELGFYSLGRLRGKARTAVPAMIELLSDRDEQARGGAIYVLGRIGPGAAASVPALLKLQESSPKIRKAMIRALASIGETSDPVLEVVFKALRDPDPSLRMSAVQACAEFGPKSKAAVPDLIHLLDDDRVNDPGLYPKPVVYALGRVGPDAKAAGPKLLVHLKDPDIEHATHAAAALLRIGIEEKPAVAAFTRALDRSRQAFIRHRTFDVVQSLGSAAKPLVPLLRSIAGDDKEDEGIRFQANRILAELAPPKTEEVKNP